MCLVSLVRQAATSQHYMEDLVGKESHDWLKGTCAGKPKMLGQSPINIPHPRIPGHIRTPLPFKPPYSMGKAWFQPHICPQLNLSPNCRVRMFLVRPSGCVPLALVLTMRPRSPFHSWKNGWISTTLPNVAARGTDVSTYPEEIWET